MNSSYPPLPKITGLNHKAIAAVVLGNALEFYDFTIYAFFAVSIGYAFFPAKNATDSLLASLALFGIGYVMRPIGGMLIGAFADRAGRKPAMMLTIVLMATGMLMLALCPSYASLGSTAQVIVIIGRLIQGLALGGEVGPSTSYLLEASPPDTRGFIASWQIASQGCAALAAGLIATALTFSIGEHAMAEWGWRVMFMLGIAIVPVGFIIRSNLPETMENAAEHPTLQNLWSVLCLLIRDHGKLLVLMFLVIGASTVSNSIGTNMPVYAKSTLGLTETISSSAPIALGTASVLFALLGGLLADRFGRRPIMIWPRIIILILAFPAFYWLARQPTAPHLYTVTFVMAALSSVNAAAIIVGIPESLPMNVRSTGLSIVYALSVSIFGGSTNYIVNKLIAVTGDKLLPAYYLIGFSVIGTIAAVMIRETRNNPIAADMKAR
jgi:MFS family permease